MFSSPLSGKTQSYVGTLFSSRSDLSIPSRREGRLLNRADLTSRPTATSTAQSSGGYTGEGSKNGYSRGSVREGLVPGWGRAAKPYKIRNAFRDYVLPGCPRLQGRIYRSFQLRRRSRLIWNMKPLAATTRAADRRVGGKETVP